MWDSVDGIAPHLVGAVFNKNKNEILHWIQKWMNSDNIWLQRSAIIFQLKYGKATDWDLLCTAILRHDASTEFFVRKAQGWALRQYSKYEPQLVLSFVQANPQLSGLTKREALRKII
ncbi:MAG: DNA alkylation repair protein [Saprospiraceae bacterium]